MDINLLQCGKVWFFPIRSFPDAGGYLVVHRGALIHVPRPWFWTGADARRKAAP
jgi:hypothetical protein